MVDFCHDCAFLLRNLTPTGGSLHACEANLKHRWFPSIRVHVNCVLFWKVFLKLSPFSRKILKWRLWESIFGRTAGMQKWSSQRTGNSMHCEETWRSIPCSLVQNGRKCLLFCIRERAGQVKCSVVQHVMFHHLQKQMCFVSQCSNQFLALLFWAPLPAPIGLWWTKWPTGRLKFVCKCSQGLMGPSTTTSTGAETWPKRKFASLVALQTESKKIIWGFCVISGVVCVTVTQSEEKQYCSQNQTLYRDKISWAVFLCQRTLVSAKCWICFVGFEDFMGEYQKRRMFTNQKRWWPSEKTLRVWAAFRAREYGWSWRKFWQDATHLVSFEWW